MSNLISSPQRRSLALGAFAFALLPKQALSMAPVGRSSAALMGTQVDIVVAHPDERLRARALDAAWAEMLRLSEMMSRYRTGSQVSLLSRAAGGPAVPVAPELMQVLTQASRVTRDSGGLFDPTVGAYADWRFEAGRPPRLPSGEALGRQRALVDPQGLQLDTRRNTARLARPGMRLDLGGIAKLPILAAGLRKLQESGIDNALVNGGGDVLCCGTLQGRAWRVGLRDPRAPERLLGAIALGDGGVVAASGDYERGFVHAGRRYHHIIDPRSGQPSQGLRGVALVARSVEAVNGWGAAMMVAGDVKARQWLASELKGVEAMLAGPQQVWLSAGLRNRLMPASA